MLLLKKVIWATGVLRRTAISHRRFGKLCGSHLQSLVRLKMASAQVIETSAANNSPSQDSSHRDDHFHSRVNKFPLTKINLLFELSRTLKVLIK